MIEGVVVLCDGQLSPLKVAVCDDEDEWAYWSRYDNNELRVWCVFC